MTGGRGQNGGLLLPLVLATVCVVALADTLPRVAPWLIALGVLAGVLRLLFVRTRGW